MKVWIVSHTFGEGYQHKIFSTKKRAKKYKRKVVDENEKKYQKMIADGNDPLETIEKFDIQFKKQEVQ